MLASSSFKIKRLRTIYILYWFLLTYIIAALVWWFIALSQQNKIMTDYKLGELDTLQQDHSGQKEKILEEKKRKTAQYIGEGATFLVLIVIGAVVVFRAVRRQFIQSQQQQHFMMAITHELKTPIAVTRLNLETLQKHKLTEEQQQQLLSNTLQEAGRLNTLCNNLLLSSRIEAGDYEVTKENIDLGDLVTECINDYKMRYPKRHIHEDHQQGIYISGDRLLLQMALNNLIDNAIKYSGRDTDISVELKKEGIVRLLVKDIGKGIPDAEKKNIFNKFYRVGNQPTKESKGTGLGLYLTKKIIEQHKGTVRVMDNEPAGSIFEINLENG
jgi:signal transduction histidine kinase